jgi:hypothetical protein
MIYFLAALLVALFSYCIFKIGDRLEHSLDPYSPRRKSNTLVKCIFFTLLLALVVTLLILSA